MTDLDALDKLAREAKARADAATKSPWEIEKTADGWDEISVIADVERYSRSIRSYISIAKETDNEVDAAFIVAARTDVPALADAVLMLTARLSEATRLLEVAGRKMVFIVRDYEGDKESRSWLKAYKAWKP